MEVGGVKRNHHSRDCRHWKKGSEGKVEPSREAYGKEDIENGGMATGVNPPRGLKTKPTNTSVRKVDGRR